jgi:CDP-diacylglycerol--glycerol-3-phosphate 3-phosphatidyltransferase
MTRSTTVALIAAALLAATMPVYALVAQSRPGDPDVARRPRTALLGRWVRDWFMWVIGPLERLFLALGVPPIAFNWAGVGCGIVAGILYARDDLPAAGWLVLLGGAADTFDGRIARARGVVSTSGAFLDSTLDRFAETFAYAGLALWARDSVPRELAAVLALGGSLLVSYARARGESLGVHYPGGLMQRAERLVLLGLASLLDPVAVSLLGWPHGQLLFVTLALIGAGALATALQRTVGIARALDRGTPGGR